MNSLYDALRKIEKIDKSKVESFNGWRLVTNAGVLTMTSQGLKLNGEYIESKDLEKTVKNNLTKRKKKSKIKQPL